MKKVIIAVSVLMMLGCTAGCGAESSLSSTQGASVTSTSVTNAAPSVSADVKDISGTWKEADGCDPLTLTINDNGTYKLKYNGSGTKSGSVSVVIEKQTDGTDTAWYVFNENDGLFWASFPKDTKSEIQNELKSGKGEKLHLVRSENEATVPDKLPEITKAEIVALYNDYGDGYMFRLDAEGDYDEWVANVSGKAEGDGPFTCVVTSKLLTESEPYIFGGSTITEIQAVVTPYDEYGNAGSPVLAVWDPDRVEKMQ